MDPARYAIHLVAFVVALFTWNHEEARFRVVKITHAFENCLDRAIDSEARVGKDCDFLQ